MSSVTTGPARACFDLKSATLPLLAVVMKTADLAALAQEMETRFGDTPDFFDQDPVVINLLPVADSTDPINFNLLVELLRSYHMQPIAVHGGSAAQRQAALKAGLVDAPDITTAAPLPQAAPPVAAPAPEPAVVVPSGALVIDKPLRSGQQVYARGSDLVVLAMVSNGAEVLADGSIHVYAPLRGRAIAGAKGNEDARIFSTCLEAELVSIAGVYRTSEIPLPAEVLGKPAQVRLLSEKLVMEAL
ncbi:septum site-determining protein MinC [Rhodoferax sp.]|uniref:septum site-determining protein MinC n=1 Tax=Rhodoferax sp. TaxID=50421 RepID=UPI0025FFDF94|nr:septum site-determining protein MinC [Rhodoferax sp.]